MPLSPSHPVQPPTSSHSLSVVRAAPKSTGEGDDGENGASSLSLRQFLHALRRRWLVAVPLAILVAGIVYLVAEDRMTPIYTARTMLHISADNPGILYDNVGGRPDAANFQRTQIATVKSRVIRQNVVRTLEPMQLATLRSKSDPVDWLEKEIVADYTVAPEILRITMKGGEPDEMVIILNAVRDCYLREILNRDRANWESKLQVLKELAAKEELALKTHRQKMIAGAEAFGERDLPSVRRKYEYLSNRIFELQKDLLLARLELEGAESPPGPREKTALDPVEVESALDQAAATDPDSDRLRKEVDRLEKKLAEYERRLLSYRNDADYKLTTSNLAVARESLSGRRDLLRKKVEDLMRAAPHANPAFVLGAPKRSASVLKQNMALLEVEIKQKTHETEKLAKGISELSVLNGEVIEKEEQLALVKSKMRPYEVELQSPPRAGMIEEAAIVETPKWDQSLKRVVAPAGLAFLCVIALVAWLDLRRGQVNGRADLEAARIRVIGAVPSVRQNVLPAFAPPQQDGSLQDFLRLTDAIDMTRAVIAPILSAAPGYTLLVTSATAGEGKTIVSAHLAARFARSGVRTLLIDTDVRRPKLNQLLGWEKGPGFGEWVSGLSSLQDLVYQGPVEGLDVIVAGGCDARSVGEMIDLRLPELLRIAKKEYDVIVLDTAPLLCSPETLALSRMADGVVLSVMRDVSRIPAVQACSELLTSIRAHLLGAVVTGDAPSRYGSY